MFGHQPFEIKQHVVNFIAEELRHHEASVLVAKALAGYQDEPRADYFKAVIPRFHDERDEKAMSFFAGLAVNTLFEQLSGELLQARYENARFASIRTACQLILRDEARHIQFGRIVMRRFFGELSADDRRLLGEKVAKKLRGSLLNGVYAVVNLPPDERARAGRNRALASEHGLGATHPDGEMAIIKRALDQIRADVAPYDVVIPGSVRGRLPGSRGALSRVVSGGSVPVDFRSAPGASMSSDPRLSARRAALAAALALATGAALAQSSGPYPNHPVTLVVPYPPGGSADVLARAIGQKLGDQLGQTVVVENRAGAATAIGAKAVARAPADGYTLLLGTVSSQSINPAMNKVGYDPVADFVAVAPIASIPFVFVANPSVPVTSVADVIALAKSKPGEIGYASAGPGTSNHLGRRAVRLGGEDQAAARAVQGQRAGAQRRAGRPRAADVRPAGDLDGAHPGWQAEAARRDHARAQQPAAQRADDGRGGRAGLRGVRGFGLFAPAGTPHPVVERLNAEVTAILKSPEMNKQLHDLGAEPSSARRRSTRAT